MDLRSRVQESLASHYTIERELGGGGMSRVFVALEHRLGRKVVVKVLSPELAASLSTTRFEREIRVAASLQQANIVPVLAAGEIDHLPYYTMPYVEGESLRARLGRGPLAISETVNILRDVARALAYAHQRGVVHRDIKPDNVLLSGDAAVVTDFGIAKAIRAAQRGTDSPELAGDPSSATLTQLGTALGTPTYMAPEQAAGDPSTDHRADLYAFGCMAYEMLVGMPPFDGPPHKLLLAHVSEAPPPVLARRPDCPSDLAALVARCLAKDPDERPVDAGELQRHLDASMSPARATAAVPTGLLGGRTTLARALAVYVAAVAVVALIARAAVITLGLPDWVFVGALVVMALGLPVILLTAYAQHVTRRVASRTPDRTPGGTPTLAVHGTMATLAIKASPHLSWTRAVRGGGIAAGTFAVVVAAFMVLRALGIGPGASLFATGKLSATDRVIVARFDAPGADSSLGPTIAEAVRTNLSQSRVVHVMPTSAIVRVLEQMQRPDTATIDFSTAREVAQRYGAKAIVAGRIVAAGQGYVVTARLVDAATGDELASYSATARDVGALIPTVDHLTKKLRERIGESLKAVRATPSLDQVTTASLGALRSYSAGLHANDIVGDYPAAVQNFRDAIRQDSTFVMAYVQLGYSLQSQGAAHSTENANAAFATAFRLRDRVPARERYNVEGAYYMSVQDRPKAIAALRRAVDLDSTNFDASNTLGVVLENVRDNVGAERAYLLSIAGDTNATVLTNLAGLYTRMGRHAAFDSIIHVVATATPFSTAGARFYELIARRQYDSAEDLARPPKDSVSPALAIQAQRALIGLLTLRGRVAEAERELTSYQQAQMRRSGGTLPPDALARDQYYQAMIDGLQRGDAARGVATLDAVRRQTTARGFPSLWTAWGYAALGQSAKARDELQRFEAGLDSAGRRSNAVYIAGTQGLIELALAKPDSAIAWFRRGDVDVDGLPSGNNINLTPLLVGQAFDRGGHSDSARKYLTQYVEMPVTGFGTFDRYYLGPTLYRLGELAETAGDTAKAIDYYGRFTLLWKNADPALQPRVAAAKVRIAELTRARG